ncbi:hypothetical protein [Streptomyces sp. NPDC056670]|uniref:hypothetical protein n=1 Tax=Streptomyces sp. NPDC056670 TaxID=3345904 RepID=UPI0036CB12D4
MTRRLARRYRRGTAVPAQEQVASVEAEAVTAAGCGAVLSAVPRPSGRLHVAIDVGAQCAGVLEGSDGDVLITTALDVVVACGRLSVAGTGRERAESISAIHQTVSLLDSQLHSNARWTAGIPRYAGRNALLAHARRVRQRLAEPLAALVTSERDAAMARLSGYALAIAAAQAQGLYGELLPEAGLPADPGPERGRWLRLVLVGAIVAVSGAGAVLVLTKMLGVSGEATLAPLGLVILYSAIAAAKATNTWTWLSSVLDRTSQARQGGSPPSGP